MKETSAMTINRETAMSLWKKSFGKTNQAKDFAGREMIKAAYNDRGSKYGWNIDHILPQSKGGKTTESNLICCHILTNDEKADKFPCFTANGKKFVIIKVENHYEIKPVEQNGMVEAQSKEEEDINFYDSAAGIRFFKKLKGIQNKSVFVGTVIIDLYGITTTAIIDFIKELFYDKSVTYGKRSELGYGRGDSFVVIVKDYNMPQKEDISEMLDTCVLLNTYLGHYFKPCGTVRNYQIFYGVHTDKDKIQALSVGNDVNGKNSHSLQINELVKINTEANGQSLSSQLWCRDKWNYNIYKYDYVYTKLAENLDKQVK